MSSKLNAGIAGSIAETRKLNARIVETEGQNKALVECVEQHQSNDLANQKELKKSFDTINRLEDQCSDLTDTVFSLDTMIAKSETEITENQRYNKKLEAELIAAKRENQQLQKRLPQLEVQNVEIKATQGRVPDLERQVGDLRAERDRLVALVEASAKKKTKKPNNKTEA